MIEDARARLNKLIDLLEPNVWLELDETSFPRYFDADNQLRSMRQETLLSDMALCSFSSQILV